MRNSLKVTLSLLLICSCLVQAGDVPVWVDEGDLSSAGLITLPGTGSPTASVTSTPLSLALGGLGEDVSSFDGLVKISGSDASYVLSLGMGTSSELTVSTGAVTVSGTFHTVDGEGDAADDLATINQDAGALVWAVLLQPEHADRDITVKHGTGNIVTPGGADYTIPDNGVVVLVYDGSNWRLLSPGAASGTFVRVDGTEELSANWDAGAYEIRAETFESDVPTGTAPLGVASETLVDNFNADLLDGTEANELLLLSGGTMTGQIVMDDDTSTAPTQWTLRSAAPDTPSAGDIYADDGTNTASGNAGLRIYDGAAWQDMGGAAAGTYLEADGSVGLSANWDAGAYEIRAETLHLDITTGTAPMTIVSTTVVSNLNADLLDGEEASAFQDADAGLADIAGLALADGNIIVGDGANWVAETGATARTSLGLAIGTDVADADGDILDIDWNPTNYTPAATPAEAADVDDLTAHLYGIDQAIAGDGAGAVDSVFGRTGAVTAAASDYDADQIDNTAAGNISATDVQAAINELDTEKQAVHNYLEDIAATTPGVGDMLYFDGTDWLVVDATGASDDDVPAVQADGSIAFQAQSGGAGTVDTSGTPVNDDIAVFTDADTIEGQTVSELGLTEVSNATQYFEIDFTIPDDDGYIGHPVFEGTGLNDMFTGGTYSSQSDLQYVVEIDGTGTPDTFKWSDDGGSTWDATTVGITGSAQTLNNGVQIKFWATTGHTSADTWRFETTGGETDDLQFQVQIDDAMDFTGIIIDHDSRDVGDGGDGQTGCRYFDGTDWQAVPASGGTGNGIAEAYHGQRASYAFQSSSISRTTLYYYRVRVHDGTSWGDWEGGTVTW